MDVKRSHNLRFHILKPLSRYLFFASAVGGLFCFPLYFEYFSRLNLSKDFHGREIRVELPDFTFHSNGEKRSLSELLKEPLYLFFGFSSCSGICPVAMQNLKIFRNKVLKFGCNPNFKIAFVSIDPYRDSQSSLETFLNRYGEGFIYIQSGDDSVSEFSKQIGYYSAAIPVERGFDPDFQIQHPEIVYYLDTDRTAKLLYLDSNPKGLFEDWKKMNKFQMTNVNSHSGASE